jgi:hypothetical protein
MNERIKIRSKLKNFLLSHPSINPYKKSLYYEAMGIFKKKPDIMIIGQMKCGTSTLYDYLVTHPKILPSARKEIKYYDYRFQYSFNWYKGNLGCWKWSDDGLKSIDASPTYFSIPICAPRIRSDVPDVKIIILLRNPIDRAYSHYQMIVRNKNENLSFEEAIKNESIRVTPLTEKNLKDPDYRNYITYSYVRYGLYIEDLKRWYNLFPKNNILIIKSEDFEENTLNEYKKVCKFLNIPEPNLDIIRYIENPKNKKMVGNYKPLEKNIRNELRKLFEPYNEQLYKFLGKDFGWN